MIFNQFIKKKKKLQPQSPSNMKHPIYKATNRSFFLLYIYIYIYIYIFFYNRYRNSDLVDHFETNKWNWLRKKLKKKPINNEYPLGEEKNKQRKERFLWTAHQFKEGTRTRFHRNIKQSKEMRGIVDVFHGNRVTILLS